MINLNGKTVIVTGASRGIGRAIVESMLLAGAEKVIGVDIHEGVLIKDDRYSFYPLDVTDEDCVDVFFQEYLSFHHYQPQVLVNCAGITKDSTIGRMTSNMFSAVIDVNLKGPWLMCKGIAPLLSAQPERDTCIINISSCSRLGLSGQSNYSASKAGIAGLTMSLAKELSYKAPIRVVAIAPGFIATDMVKSMPEPVLEKLSKQSSLKRLGTPKEIGDLTTFLASDNAAFITGTVIECDGGLLK